MPHLSVDIPVAADWPTPDDMDARNAITDELDAMSFGKFIGAGGGLGSMDFSYTVADGESAERTVRQVIAKHTSAAAWDTRC